MQTFTFDSVVEDCIGFGEMYGVFETNFAPTLSILQNIYEAINVNFKSDRWALFIGVGTDTNWELSPDTMTIGGNLNLISTSCISFFST